MHCDTCKHFRKPVAITEALLEGRFETGMKTRAFNAINIQMCIHFNRNDH